MAPTSEHRHERHHTCNPLRRRGGAALASVSGFASQAVSACRRHRNADVLSENGSSACWARVQSANRSVGRSLCARGRAAAVRDHSQSAADTRADADGDRSGGSCCGADIGQSGPARADAGCTVGSRDQGRCDHAHPRSSNGSSGGPYRRFWRHTAICRDRVWLYSGCRSGQRPVWFAPRGWVYRETFAVSRFRTDRCRHGLLGQWHISVHGGNPDRGIRASGSRNAQSC